MTYEQKYGRLPDGFYHEEAPPEDWQFENPLVTVSKDGEVKSRLQKTFARASAKPPKMRPISEILNKEDDGMDFIKLDMDKQVRMVAEAYSKGLGPSATQEKLGIKGASTYYDRLDRARAMGLVTEMRGQGSMPQQVIVQEAPEPPKATVEDFAKQAEGKLELAERLAKEAELLQQAGTIAQALTELLGDQAGDLVAGLYSKVST